MKRSIVLRHEIKKNEKRSPLTPAGASELVANNIKVYIESSSSRIFKDIEYSSVGCEIVQEGYWRTCSTDSLILGLKELPIEELPLKHSHIYFAHIFKGQAGSKQIFKRYSDGGGELFDLEFLKDGEGRRICAFGYWAGYVGAALALFEYYLKDGLQQLKYFESKTHLINILKEESKNKSAPKTLIIGALGRCGTGANDLLTDIGLNATKWDREETKKGGPFVEILSYDIFINAALLFNKVSPFITTEILNKNKSRLKIISDVSCDPTSELNPIPLYNESTSWKSPGLKINKYDLSIIAVDNLPSVLPRESSEDFSAQLFPYLLEFLKKEELPLPFLNAKSSFSEHRV